MAGELTINPLQSKDEIVEFLETPTNTLAETLTGILGSDSAEFRLSAGKLIQAWEKNSFLKQLAEEIKYYQKKGIIKGNIIEDTIDQQNISELLLFIDTQSPTKDRFEAMRNLYFYSLIPNIGDDRKIFAYQLMKIVEKLTSNQLQIIFAAYQIYLGHMKVSVDIAQRDSYAEWSRNIARQIGHNTSELVDFDDNALVEYKLLSNRTFTDHSGIIPTRYYRLTTLGFEITRIITESVLNETP